MMMQNQPNNHPKLTSTIEHGKRLDGDWSRVSGVRCRLSWVCDGDGVVSLLALLFPTLFPSAFPRLVRVPACSPAQAHQPPSHLISKTGEKIRWIMFLEICRMVDHGKVLRAHSNQQVFFRVLGCLSSPAKFRLLVRAKKWRMQHSSPHLFHSDAAVMM